MGDEIPWCQLMCKELFQEQDTFTDVPSSHLLSQPLELVADTRDTSKGAEKGLHLSNM